MTKYVHYWQVLPYPLGAPFEHIGFSDYIILSAEDGRIGAEMD